MRTKTAQIHRFEEKAQQQLKTLIANDIVEIKTMMSQKLARELYETMIWFIDTSKNTSPYPLCKPKIDRIAVRGWWLLTNSTQGEVELKFIPSNIIIGKLFPPSIYFAFNKNIYLQGYTGDYIYLLWEYLSLYSKIFAQLETIGATTIKIPLIAWYDPAWNYRKSHIILPSPSGIVTDYPIKIIVHYGSGIDSGQDVYLNGKCRTDFGDIRFTDSDGVTELPYWIEEKVDGDYAIFWVKIPLISEYNVEHGEWIVDGNTYHHRLKITVKENSGNNLTDYPVRVIIDTKRLVDKGYATSTGNEIRFTDSDGTTLLYFYRENDFNQSKTIYWVKIPSLPANTTKTIYIYFDEELTTIPDASNGKNTFIIYEDMESTPEGTLYNDAYYDADNKWVRLTRAVNSINGELDYLTENIGLNIGEGFRAKFQFWSGGGSGADAVWLQFYNTSIPTSEDDAWDGYIVAYDEYNDQIQLKFDGATLRAVSRYDLDNETWRNAEITFYNFHIRIYLDGLLKIDYTDTTRSLTGNHFGWGARTGGYNNEHRIRNLIVMKYIDPEPTVEIDKRNVTIYIYYGNPNATSQSNPKQVFIIYEDMESTPEGTLYNDAYYDADNKWVRLTRAVNSINGELDYLTENIGLNIGEGFRAKFQFWIGGGSGADALWLHFYTTVIPTDEDYSAGGYMVAYDEWQDEIQLNIDGVKIQTFSQTDLDNATWRDAEILYSNHNIKIYLDGILKIQLEKGDTYLTGNHFGWGARTGGYNNEHRIRNLIVMKYIDPEPSHGEWGSEESKP